MIRNFKKLTSLYALLIFFILSHLYLSGQYKIDPRFEELIKERKNNLHKKPNNSLINNKILPIVSVVTPDGIIKEYFQAIIYTNYAEQLKKDGFIVQSESKDFVTALLSESDLLVLKDYQYVSTVNLPEIDYSNNQSNVIKSGATLLQNGVLNNTNYTGKDILIGIYDSGIDFTHPDFINPITKESRILRIWDQTLTPINGEKSPKLYDNFNYGVEYLQSDINNEINGVPANFVREKDISGHGTHVAGTAAGNGSALEGNPHKGMAPEAMLVIVKGGNGTFSRANTIASLDYFKKIADEQNKPIVVNMSIGSQSSSHDGKATHEIKINEFSTSGPGRVAVVAAGNEGNGKIHQRIILAPKEKKTFEIEIGKNKKNNDNALFSFLIFSKENNAPTVTASIILPNGETLTQKVGGRSVNEIKNNEGEVFQKITISNYFESNSRKRRIRYDVDRVNNDDTKGIYSLEVENTSNGKITLDGWLIHKNSSLASIKLSNGDNYYTIGTPGTADEAITVANYITNATYAVNTNNPKINPEYSSSSLRVEALSSSSSKGPRSDEARKPDIAAGGTNIISTKTKDNAENIDKYIIDGKYYSKKNGTSMSSPAVAGAVALLLQANKQLTAKEVKKRLIDNVYKDEFTTNDFTNEFGYGKLNIYKAVSAEVNKLNDNESCPISYNYTLSNDNIAYIYGEKNGTSIVNYKTNHVGVKLKSQITGKLGNVTFFLGNYNSNTTQNIPLIIEIRNVNKKGVPGDLLATKTIKNIKTLTQFGWNNENFADEDINIVNGQEFFVIIKTQNNIELLLGTDTKDINGKTYISSDSGTSFITSNKYNTKIRALVYENLPAVKQLATTSKEATQVLKLGYNHFINGCELITRIEINKGIPISQNVIAKTWINTENKGFVQKTTEINTNGNNFSPTGKITLYYTQNDFNLYNNKATVKLPASPTDDINKENLIIYYYSSKNKDNTASASSYETSPIGIKVDSDNVVWNNLYKYWEITVDISGLGRFLLSTDSKLANIENTLNQLIIYPNPVINDLSINLPSNINYAQISIINISGQIIMRSEINQNHNKINLSNLPKGVYIVEIKTTNGTITKKIIKN